MQGWEARVAHARAKRGTLQKPLVRWSETRQYNSQMGVAPASDPKVT
jgi:hypothetical protein